jgi:DNA-binding HxlR family transcriptional regulator
MVRNAEKSATKKRAPKPASPASPPPEPPDVGGMVESIIGCKWSLHVLRQIQQGNNRPGSLTRSAPGLTTKVLNERLARMVRFNILRRVAHPQIPPRVEYHFTPFGQRFLRILDAVAQLESDVLNCKIPWPTEDDVTDDPPAP